MLTIKNKLIFFLSLLFITVPSYASLIELEFTDGSTGFSNDCSGYWNSMQDADHVGCWIFTLDDDEVQYLSPIIAKVDPNESNDTGFSLGEGDGEYSGSWANDGTEDDVRFWSVKAGSGNENNDGGWFLYFMGDDALCNGEGNGNYNFDCLNTASVVTEGLFNTPGGFGLSHISFYDGDGGGTGNCNPSPCPPPPPPPPVPEPQTLLIFVTALLGLIITRKKIVK